MVKSTIHTISSAVMSCCARVFARSVVCVAAKDCVEARPQGSSAGSEVGAHRLAPFEPEASTPQNTCLHRLRLVRSPKSDKRPSLPGM